MCWCCLCVDFFFLSLFLFLFFFNITQHVMFVWIKTYIYFFSISLFFYITLFFTLFVSMWRLKIYIYIDEECFLIKPQHHLNTYHKYHQHKLWSIRNSNHHAIPQRSAGKQLVYYMLKYNRMSERGKERKGKWIFTAHQHSSVLYGANNWLILLCIKHINYCIQQPTLIKPRLTQLWF